ncbi:hypothetical protein PMAC_003269 [Pneumocystis sp. 'macacae']|nr:hypothetical protein PMAC_003269 [Pneumocystis sp. 'macacae']
MVAGSTYLRTHVCAVHSSAGFVFESRVWHVTHREGSVLRVMQSAVPSEGSIIQQDTALPGTRNTRKSAGTVTGKERVSTRFLALFYACQCTVTALIHIGAYETKVQQPDGTCMPKVLAIAYGPVLYIVYACSVYTVCKFQDWACIGHTVFAIDLHFVHCRVFQICITSSIAVALLWLCYVVMMPTEEYTEYW